MLYGTRSGARTPNIAVDGYHGAQRDPQGGSLACFASQNRSTTGRIVVVLNRRGSTGAGDFAEAFHRSDRGPAPELVTSSGGRDGAHHPTHRRGSGRLRDRVAVALGTGCRALDTTWCSR